MSGTAWIICLRISKHFMVTGLSATSLKSFAVDVSAFFSLGSGMMVDVLKVRGATSWVKDGSEDVCINPQAVSCRPSELEGNTILQGVHLLHGSQDLCWCHLKSGVPWVAGGFLGSLCI